MNNFIEYKDYKIYISSTPNDNNINLFVDKLIELNIKTVVRLCEKTYDENKIIESNILFYDYEFEDGTVPDETLYNKWLDLIDNNKDGNILVHCFGGKGRAPLFATIALINNKIKTFDAITLIREKVPGALNIQQLNYIMKLKIDEETLFSKFMKLFK